MKVIIAGSRTINSKPIVLMALVKSGFSATEIVSGCARGVDKLGELIARENGIPVTCFPPDWEEHGRSAGFMRNLEMAQYGDALVAVWDGRSGGTKHMIEMAKRCELKIYIHKVD